MRSLKNIIVVSVLSLLFFGIAYPLSMTGLANLIAPEGSRGYPIYKNDTLVGFQNIGQNFTDAKYFWGRPSAVSYDASSTGGSNFGTNNPELLKLVQQRIDTLLAYNPTLEKKDIPVELVTASGSGLDPHISKKAAMIQVNRIAEARALSKEKIKAIINENTQEAFLGFAGPENYLNVLKLNISLDQLKQWALNH